MFDKKKTRKKDELSMPDTSGLAALATHHDRTTRTRGLQSD